MATAQDRKQLLEEMWNRCGEVSALIIDMKETLYPRVFCETEIEYLLERLRYVRFSLDEQSIMRIIEACDPRKTLGEFAPALAEELRNRGLEGISRMTLR
ncbi:MAG: hypothetical protein N3D79_06490, partial [Acidilobaceae archaeon]|nr:hypothetical protein [Acidilobaceae archaeon]